MVTTSEKTEGGGGGAAHCIKKKVFYNLMQLEIRKTDLGAFDYTFDLL